MRYRIYKNAKEKLEEIGKFPDQYNVIHYSCESFYGLPRAPRIVTVAARNLKYKQSKCFSVQKIAEEKHIDVYNMEQYEEIERILLESFFNYLEENKDKTWIHWNMSSDKYGFSALEHRARVLGVTPFVLPDEKKLDLKILFNDYYGEGYIPDRQMEELIRKNNLHEQDLLTGAEEAEVFEKGNFLQMEMSTLRKVDIFEKFVSMANSNTLKTESSIVSQYGITPQGLYDGVKGRLWFNFIIFVLGILANALFSKLF